MDFISEPVTPDAGTFSPQFMAQGLASLPAGFTWRDRHYDIVECLEHVKQTSTEGGTDQGDRYLRRQVFTVLLDTGQKAVLYLERQSRPGISVKARKQRWFLYTIERG